MNAYDVLKDHHNVLRGLCQKMTSTPPGTAERHDCIDELMLELDIHMRIEDDIFYPALSAAAANALVAIAHAEHRQVLDQLAVALRTPPKAPGYEDEWESFKKVLEAHADEEERDMIPAPVEISDEQLNAVGDQMLSRMEKLRGSTLEKLQVKGKTALLRA